ncbi:MAG: hypothetical protein J5704_01480 [Paludibacteraceae bacterium]|nr:hypothetical protein [Paludibacteraceae bacterium]
MKKSYLHVFSVLTTVLVLLAGCRSEIRLDNVDPTIEAQMKLALPIGSISAKVSDFMGTSDESQFYIDTLNGKGVVTFKRSFEFEKSITDFDFSGKIGGHKYFVNLHQQIANVLIDPQIPGLQPQPLIKNDSINIPDGYYSYSGKMTFDVKLAIDSLNQPGKNLRLDSAQLTTANFTIQLSKQDFNDLDWNWIDSIELDWGDNIKGVPNRYQVVYYKGDGTSPADMKYLNNSNITLDLVKDHSKAASMENVYDSVKLVATVKYTVPSNTHIAIQYGSGLNCDFQVAKLEPKAFWGWFLEKPVDYSDAINISYNPYTFLNGARLPLAQPRIDATLETPIAGNVKLGVDYIYSEDSAGVKHYATWNDSQTYNKVFTEADGCINPKTSAITDVAKLNFGFDYTKENGDIDNLLTEMPRKLAYKLTIDFDKATTPQIRVAGDVYAKAKATATVPIEFHKGIKIAYSDTIKGIKLEQASIDSLLKEVNWVDTLKTTNVHVYATVYNGIPLDIKGTFYCLDADNNKIMDPNNPSQVWTIFTDTLNLPGGTYDTGTRDVTPAKKLNICEMTRERLDLFPKIKSIVYDAYVTDDCIQSAPFGAQINGTNSVKVTLGLTADIDAVINVLNIKTDDVRL